MSFLNCKPSVCAIYDRYEILINTEENGQCSVTVGDETFYDQKSGILVSEVTHHKIAVPMALLDAAGGYTVHYKKSIDRKSYFSEFGETQSEFFSFRPVKPGQEIRMYHLADVHKDVERAVLCASYFGDQLDLLIVNGDIVELRKEADFFTAAKMVGDITGGEIPVIYIRGNHDTRGQLADRYAEYFPAENGNCYYTVTLGDLWCVIHDCGEDKLDGCPEYGGANLFAPYRRQQTKFLQALSVPEGKVPISIGHACPVRPNEVCNPVFAIEMDVYSQWNREFERLGVRFMLTGHRHDAEFVGPEDGIINHNYPVIVGATQRGKPDKYLTGCAITYTKDGFHCEITDTEHQVLLQKDYPL